MNKHSRTPAQGYLADDFARFREQRLRETGRLPAQPPAELPPSEQKTEAPLFFGLSRRAQRSISDQTENERQDREALPTRPTRPLRRRRAVRRADAERQTPPPLPRRRRVTPAT